MLTNDEIKQRLERHIMRAETGCWVWTGAVSSNGYSSIGIDKKVRSAHRVSYEAYKGPIPDGMTIDHLCRVKRCVNPEHLEAVSGRENNARHIATITHCKAGHPLSGDNLLNHKRQRVCRECNRLAQRERYRQRKGAPVRTYVRHDPSSGPVHGTVSTYTNHACRCDPCRAAGAEYYQRARARKAAN